MILGLGTTLIHSWHKSYLLNLSPLLLSLPALVLLALKEQTETFLKRGGKALFVVGVSRRVTTLEGLQVLLELVAKGADVRVFNNDNPSVIFHPKGYLLEGVDRAVLLVGSNNLTGKGLFENYELSLACELNPKDKRDAKVISEIKEVLSRSCNSKDGLCKALTADFLKELDDAGYLGSEARGTNTSEEDGESDNGAKLPPQPKKRLFGVKGVKAAPKFAKTDQASSVKAGTAGVAAPATAPATPPASDHVIVGGGFWKALSSWDVNPHSAPGQIQIPIHFSGHFPPMHPTPGFEARTKGRQNDTTFPVIFVDASGHGTNVEDARFITYEPMQGHRRPNTEARFTFHDKSISKTLKQDDVLVFEKLVNSRYKFRVRHITPKNPEYDKLHVGRGKKNRFGSF